MSSAAECGKIHFLSELSAPKQSSKPENTGKGDFFMAANSVNTVFEYLAWRGDLSFQSSPFNEVDGVILARLSYMPFEYLEDAAKKGITVGDAARKLLLRPDIKEIALIEGDVPLLDALKDNERFCGMVVSDFVNEIDEKTQTQFSAVCIKLDENESYISFRGTDNTLVGWKEDFNMGFVCPVPSQVLATEYLNQAAKRHETGTFRVGGHSKGGNLAVYAAAFCEKAVKERISAVYNYDGPGFDRTVLEKDGYREICERTRTFVPQSSVVGMLLGHEEAYTIVHSTQVGIMQHDLYSWEVMRNRFVYLDTVTGGSKMVDYTLKNWLAQTSAADRERVIDAVYAIFAETHVRTVKELSENWYMAAKSMIKTLNGLDEPTRALVNEAIATLMKSARIGFDKTFRDRKEK